MKIKQINILNLKKLLKNKIKFIMLKILLKTI